MTYRHGVFSSEVPTSILPPRRISAALPVVIGTAPVHMRASGITGPVNLPVLCYSYAEAVAAFAYSEDWASYTLSEVIKAYFGLFNVAPMVIINVFDPAVHKTAVTNEQHALVAGETLLTNPGLVGTTVVKPTAEGTPYVEGTDYDLDMITGRITRISTGTIPLATSTLYVAYSYGDPSKVDADDIIGGVDGSTGKYTGLELINKVFPMFRLVSGIIGAPGWSQDPAVAAVMNAKCSNINGHFKAMCIVDLPDTTVTKYSDAPAYKTTNNLTDEQMIVCWPKVKLGDDTYWLSSQLIGLIARTDANNEDVPYKSPSNENLQMTAAVANGIEVWLGPEEAQYLNGQGIFTALNFIGGWKGWGNRTGAYPDVTDVKDVFIPIRRMFNWICNTLQLTFWQEVDYPGNKRLIETVVDSANIWLNGLVPPGYLLGGRVEFRQDENPVTDIMDGIFRFHVYLTPPGPAREMDFILEYDPAYLASLFEA